MAMQRTFRLSTSRRSGPITGLVLSVLVVGAMLLPAGCTPEQPPEPAWRTVVNNGDIVPGTTTVFNSYNQPSVNKSGLVVFRARSKGSAGRGVFSRKATDASAPLDTIAQVGDLVPAPNNLDGTFNEFPSIPRIDDAGDVIATRGQSVPVWSYTPDGGVETRVGTSGIYATTSGGLRTAASLLGAVPGFGRFAVPGFDPPIRFDQFPGAPAVDGSTVAFKGNFTAASGSGTGIFYRGAADDATTQVIASSATRIPDQPDVGGAPGTVTFGSTAPPSAAAGQVVFTGLDNEDAPTLGGIYLAPLAPLPALRPLVSIGDPVPGTQGADVFSSLGEGLSFDGRFVTFWGGWGATTPLTLTCPEDGNQDLLAYCRSAYPNGFTTQVPVHQGIFVHDIATGVTHAVALADSSSSTAEYSTLQYWTYSGKPPTGSGGDDSQELPRWRASAFAAVSSYESDYSVAFKATKPSGRVGIYLATGPSDPSIRPVVESGASGPEIDPEAPADTFVTTVGLERDGFRGRYLALAVGMANADASTSWGGVYLVTVNRLGPPPDIVVPPAAVPPEPHVQQVDS